LLVYLFLFVYFELDLIIVPNLKEINVKEL
jgi:hypothetical protein